MVERKTKVAEQFFMDNDFILDEDVISISDAVHFMSIIRALERDEDKTYHLNVRDRGLTMEEFDTFIKYLYSTLGRRDTWLKSWLCMFGPVTYDKFKDGVERRIKKNSVADYFV